MALSNRARIEAVMTALENRGVMARADFWDCNTCAADALLHRELPVWQGNEPPVGYVFFHEQATDSANAGGLLLLSHGSWNEADESSSTDEIFHAQQLVTRMIIEEFQEHGFGIEWGGNLNMKIGVVEPRGGWYLDYDRETEDDYRDDED
jgi:hypothetical protein